MAFEVVVRPVVFPDIRPAPAQPVLPADDPTQGFATISGNPAKTIQVSESYSSSISSNQRSEVERRVDETRVYQMSDDGKVNKDNFVDIDIANRIKMKGAPTQKVRDTGTTEPGMAGTEKELYYYDPIKEKDNIEIKRRNIIKKKGEEV
jgi:hypothetical protein